MPSAGGSFEQTAGSEVPSISISILSPSTGIPPQLSFPALLTSTTVGELKRHIQSQVSFKPDLDRLKLIHRGRVLSRDEDTMVDVFGSSALDDPGRKTLHLNLRPLEGELAAPQTFASYVAGNQRMRAAAGNSGLQENNPNSLGDPNTINDSNTPRAQGITTGIPSVLGPGLPGSGNGFTRVFTGPNGQQWQTTVNYSSSVTIPNIGQSAPGPSVHPQNFTQIPMGGHPVTSSTLSMSALVAAVEAAQRNAMTGLLSQSTTNHSNNSQPGDSQPPINPRSLDPDLEQIDVLRNRINVLQGHLRHLLEISSGIGSLNPPTTQSGLSDTELSTTTAVPPSNNGASGLADQGEILSIAQSAEQTNSGDTVMYLLSSPEGPRAVLVSPTGLFSSSSPVIGQGPAGMPRPYQPGGRNFRMQQHLAEMQRRRDLGHPRRDAVMHYQRHPGHNAMPRRNNQPQAGPARQGEWIRFWQQIAPFRDNIWLMLRLVGFVFLFTGRGSWQRVVLFGLGALTVFLIQTGVLGPVVEHLWAPLRRHLEEVIRSVDNRRLQPHANNPQEHNADNQAPRNAELQAPQQAGLEGVVAPGMPQPERLDRTWVYEMIRSLERAVVMFGSSLVPGLWERHIAARAEADRQAEAELQRETRRIEEQALAQAQAEAQTGGDDTTEGDEPNGGGEGEQRAQNVPVDGLIPVA